MEYLHQNTLLDKERNYTWKTPGVTDSLPYNRSYGSGPMYSINLTWNHFNVTTDINRDYRIRSVVNILKNTSTPIIWTVGILGSVLSVIVFWTPRMRKSPSALFLVGLNVVDSLFLTGALLTWIDAEKVPILTTAFTCRCVIFITHVASFLSVWFIIGFSFERFFAICFPLRTRICGMFRKKMVVTCLTVAAIGIYQYNFWTVAAYNTGARYACAFRPDYMYLLEVVTWVDSALTMVVPLIIILVLNTIISLTLWKLSTQRREHKPTRASRKRNYRKPHIMATKLLLVVSTTFLVLNLPSHAIRLYGFFTLQADSGHSISQVVFLLQEFANLLHFSSYASNFFLYVLFGRNFKQSLKDCILHARSRNSNHLQHISLDTPVP